MEIPGVNDDDTKLSDIYFHKNYQGKVKVVIA